MARPRSEVSKAVLSLPRDMPVNEVVAKLKARGVKTTENNVYRVRRLMMKPRPKPPVPPKPPSKPQPFDEAESLLRAVAAEIGLGRALEILQAERSKVRAVLG